MLERRKPLKRTGGLKRTDMKRGTSELQRRTRIRQESTKHRAARADHPQIREAVFKRDGYRCQLATVPGTGECFGGLTPHHKHKEGQGGPYTMANLVTLCEYHNSVWVETHYEEARALGLHISPWEAST